jgi:predicted nucleotidyltransferase
MDAMVASATTPDLSAAPDSPARACDHHRMDSLVMDDAVERLRASGAEFAYLHGSRVSGTARADSDFDVAAYFADPVPASFEVDVPSGIDLLILNDAPLEIAGRIALEGQLIFDDSPVHRVHWESQTRKVYSDEKYRIDRSHRDFLEEATRGR